MNLFELSVKISADTSQAEKGMKSTQGVSETLTNKIKVLSAQFEAAQKNVDKLTQEFNESVNKAGATDKATQELAKKLSDAEKEAGKFAKELDSVQKEADQAENSLDGCNEEIEDTGKKAEKSGNSLANFAGKLGKGLATEAKIGTAAVGAAAAGIVALTKSAVDGFAEYEQLAGGAAKIFDEMNQADILRDAQNAYKDLGLSANQYLAVINDVGATFAATMGDSAGYEAAKTGLKAISDYASGTGKNVNELSQKFTLITRSTASYQSIADQFSGILPATSAGFLEQAQAAGILSDSYKQLTEVPIAEYQDAVSKMLEKGVADLGLANNTMDEAFSTLSGSLAMAKGAWSNLVTGLADDNADLDMLISNFVESVVAASKNIIPTIGKALNGIGTLINEVVPIALQYIPQIITELLPQVAESAVGIVTSIGTAIFDNIDQILEFGQQMLTTLLDGVNNATGSQMSGAITNIITTFGSFILENLPEILMAGYNILVSLVYGIINAIPQLATAAIRAIIQFASYITSPENVEKIETLGPDLVNALVEGIVNFLDPFIDAGADIVDSIKKGISDAWEGLKSWFNSLWDSLFGNRTVNVNVNKTTSGINGSFASGLSYVPFDGFIAELHRGERILTASEASEYNRGENTNNTSGITIIQNIQSVPQTPVEFAAATEAYFEQARWAFA